MTTARSLALILATAAGISAFGVAGFTQSKSGGAAAEAQQPLAVGDVLPAGQVHIISEPGLYGLGRNVGGSAYAVAKGQLIRIDPKTMKVLSILRPQRAILD
ncbi:hypothetical protein [uncultured Paracoccus sp.]|uniref:hypothetical protein n=1 Tax=uncultured Paracoccus sp. TaxID=189685 RepID=UPI00260E12AC|nr:hypothetical protein [uncultured Paracoccus sp.]